MLQARCHGVHTLETCLRQLRGTMWFPELYRDAAQQEKLARMGLSGGSVCNKLRQAFRVGMLIEKLVSLPWPLLKNAIHVCNRFRLGLAVVPPERLLWRRLNAGSKCALRFGYGTQFAATDDGKKAEVTPQIQIAAISPRAPLHVEHVDAVRSETTKSCSTSPEAFSTQHRIKACCE